VSFVPNSDATALEETRNEGNYHDVKLRDLLPKAEQRVILSAEKLGLSQSTQSTTPMQVALIDFTDETDSQLYTWLSSSIPDAIDQSMRRDFEYKRQQSAAKANLVISGSYSLVEKDKIRILAMIFSAMPQRFWPPRRSTRRSMQNYFMRLKFLVIGWCDNCISLCANDGTQQLALA